MSEFKVNLDETNTETTQEPRDDPMIPDEDASTSEIKDLVSTLSSTSIDSRLSASEQDGLLSLPWEILSHITSHLPAQFVRDVLPKVCRTFRMLGNDNTAWQLRARRLIGSRRIFPVGPKKDFDWVTACLEMEQLITYWAGEKPPVTRQAEGGGVEMSEEWLQEEENEMEEVDSEDEDVDEALVDVAHDPDEGVEVAIEEEGGGMQPALEQIGRLRVELEDRFEVGAPAVVENGVLEFQVEVGENAAIAVGENLAEQVEMIQPQTPRSPSPPSALEHLILPSTHIAQVNSVLLLGREAAVCASASRDWNVKLWNLRDGPNGALINTLIREGDFSSHRGWVWCLASKGSLLASGGFDSTVRLWDLEEAGADRGLIRTAAAVLCLSFQGDVLLTGTFDKRVSVFDIRVPDPLIKSIRIHTNAVMCLSVDDNYIVSGSKDCTVALYDRRAGKILNRIKMNSYLLSMTDNGNEIWAGDNKGMLHSFSIQAGSLKLLSQYDLGHTRLINGIHKSPGTLYTCSSDRTVKIHIPCGPPKNLYSLYYESGVHGLSVQDGVLAVAFGDVNMEIWRPRT